MGGQGCSAALVADQAGEHRLAGSGAVMREVQVTMSYRNAKFALSILWLAALAAACTTSAPQLPTAIPSPSPMPTTIPSPSPVPTTCETYMEVEKCPCGVSYALEAWEDANANEVRDTGDRPLGGIAFHATWNQWKQTRINTCTGEWETSFSTGSSTATTDESGQANLFVTTCGCDDPSALNLQVQVNRSPGYRLVTRDGWSFGFQPERASPPSVPPPAPTDSSTDAHTGPTPEPIAAWVARTEGVTLAGADVPRAETADVPPADITELAAGINGFACDLYHAILAGDENLVFSPYSISQALAMTYAGARGETARQMARVLGFTLPQERLHPAFNALNARHMSHQPTTPGMFELNIANALWSQQGRRFLPEFLTTLGKYYGTGILQLDFKANPAAAVNTINQWASDMTDGRIPAVLDSLSGKEQFVLANAVYFTAAWAIPFNTAQTEKEAFHLLDGSSVTVDMMHQVNSFVYTAGKDYQAIALPYGDGT